MTAQQKRLLSASICLCFLVALPVAVAQFISLTAVVSPTCGVSFVSSVSQAVPGEQAVPNLLNFDENLPQKVFERLVRIPAESTPEAAFTREVLEPATLGTAQTYTADGLVGICWAQQPKVLVTDIETELKMQGWQRIGASEIATTYIKETGEIRWLYVSVVQTGQATTALFAYTYQEES